MTKKKEFDLNFKEMLEEAIDEAIRNSENNHKPFASVKGYPEPFNVFTKFIEDNKLIIKPSDIRIINSEINIDGESCEPYVFESYYIYSLAIEISIVCYHISGSTWHYFFKKNN